jgi:small subunit ribosomal protein S2
MAQPQLQDLLEAGVHFGHQTRRWNPKMRRFIFAERSGIYIIDLQKTLRQLEAAQDLLRSVVLKGEGVLFVCTKRQLKLIIQGEAQRCGSFYVTERWLGGTLTNFQTIKKQIKRLKDLEQGVAEGDFENYTKKEQLLFDRERVKLDKYLSGIKNMNRIPGALFVVDSKKERIAVSLLAGSVADVISEARRQMPLREVTEEGEAATYSTETGPEGESEGDRKRKSARRKRRPKPEAIAARLKTDETPAPAESGGGGEG